MLTREERVKKSRYTDMGAVQDAKEAMENMNNSELFGRVLRVNIARPQRAKAEGSGKAGTIRCEQPTICC